jgi:hypothetical protein
MSQQTRPSVRAPESLATPMESIAHEVCTFVSAEKLAGREVTVRSATLAILEHHPPPDGPDGDFFAAAAVEAVEARVAIFLEAWREAQRPGAGAPSVPGTGGRRAQAAETSGDRHGHD